MTKKKLRYSELAPAPAAPAPAAVDPDAGVAPTPAAAAPVKLRAPLDLARALAAARRAEQAAEQVAEQGAAQGAAAAGGPARAEVPFSAAAVPAAARATVGRLTPMRGSATIPRPTPHRASVAIVRDALPPAAFAATPSSLRDRARARTGRVDLLIFRVASEWFGVELAAVEEAIDLPAVHHVPEMPTAMLGVVPVRGALTSVYSPAGVLGVSLETGASALVFRRERGRLGLAVDDVDDVHSLDLAQLRDAPARDALDGLVLGVLRHRDGLLALIDAETLIAACQAIPLLETA